MASLGGANPLPPLPGLPPGPPQIPVLPPAQGQLGAVRAGWARAQVPPPLRQAQAPPPQIKDARAAWTNAQPTVSYKQLMKAPALKANEFARAELGGPKPAASGLVDPKVLKETLGRNPSFLPKQSELYKEVLTNLKHFNKAANQPVSAQVVDRSFDIEQLRGLLAKAADAAGKHYKVHGDAPMQALEQELRHLDKSLAAMIKDPPLPGIPPSYKQALAMRELGMPPGALGDLQHYDATAITASRPLGSGAVNMVHLVAYSTDTAPKVFKAVSREDTNPANKGVASGIDPKDPRYANRNVATSIVNNALQLDIIPKTRFAQHGEQFGFVMAKAEGKAPKDLDPRPLPLKTPTYNYAGTISSVQGDVAAAASALARAEKGGNATAIGKAQANYNRDADSLLQLQQANNLSIVDGVIERHATVADEFNSADPVLMQKLSQLEWLDKLTGQVDRHPGNYMIEQVPNNAPPPSHLVTGVKGIDNDYSFGATHRDPSQAVSTTGSELNNLPLLVDRGVATQMKQLQANWDSPGGLKSQLADLLTPAELSATKDRLDALCAHVDTLAGQGKVVDNWLTWDDGNGQSAHDVLTANPTASYVGTLHQLGETAHQQKLEVGLTTR